MKIKSKSKEPNVQLTIQKPQLATSRKDAAAAIAKLQKTQKEQEQLLKEMKTARADRQIYAVSITKEPLIVEPTGQLVWAYDTTGATVCGAKNSSYGKEEGTKNRYCLRRDVKFPSGRCSRHQGTRLSAILHPRYKGDALSHPNSKAERYSGMNLLQRHGIKNSLNDPNLTSMRKDIAAFDERIREISQKFSALDPRIFKKVIETANTVKQAASTDLNNPKKLKILLEELENHFQFINELQEREINWRELENAQSHRAKLVDVESKRTSSEQTQIPVGRVAGLVQRISRGVSAQIREGTDRFIEAYFKWPEEKKSKRIETKSAIIACIEKAIMDDVRPVISQFFPRPDEINPTDMDALAEKEKRIQDYKDIQTEKRKNPKPEARIKIKPRNRARSTIMNVDEEIKMANELKNRKALPAKFLPENESEIIEAAFVDEEDKI